MGSMISELLDIASLGRKAQKEIKGDPDHVKDSKTVAAFFQKAKSISSRASKYVLEYPTICSSSISDYNTALAIAKQVEFDCARFVVLSAGLNPFVRLDKDDTIALHIDDLISSYEDYSGLKLSIKPATEDEIRNCEQWLNSGDFNKPYQSFKTKSFSNESFLSMEMDTVNTNAPEVADEASPEAVSYLNRLIDEGIEKGVLIEDTDKKSIKQQIDELEKRLGRK